MVPRLRQPCVLLYIIPCSLLLSSRSSLSSHRSVYDLCTRLTLCPPVSQRRVAVQNHRVTLLKLCFVTESFFKVGPIEVESCLGRDWFNRISSEAVAASDEAQSEDDFCPLRTSKLH